MQIKELVIISGKGGTGKTSIAASFAALARNKVTVDCDVDAANMHIVMNHDIQRKKGFKGGKEAYVDPDLCTGCGTCFDHCRYNAVKMIDKLGKDKAFIEDISCEGCGVCVEFCPEGAVTLIQQTSGEWYISNSSFGPFIHARLGIAQENSGKLVTLLRLNSRILAKENDCELIIIDGSPGIGCPVIASITASSMVLAVTEPTLSGIHDLERIVELVKGFKTIPLTVCINKYDINIEITKEIEKYCAANKLCIVGSLPYDYLVTKAQIAGVSVVEYTGARIALSIKKMWRKIYYSLIQ